MELTIRNITKTYYSGVQALKNISLTIPPGIFGILGPVGAGNSMLTHILAHLQEPDKPDKGSIHPGNIDVLNRKDEVSRKPAYLPLEFGVYLKVRAEELPEGFALLRDITQYPSRTEAVEALLRQANLCNAPEHKPAGFSGGMRQRSGLAVAQLGNLELMIADEPGAGLDPAERGHFLSLLSEPGENSLVILSTHIAEDVSEPCIRMTIIDRGQILLETEPLQAVEELQGRIWRRVIGKSAFPELEREYDIISTKLLSGHIVVRVYSEELPGKGFESVEPELEDIYFSTMAGHYGLRRGQPEPELAS